MVSVRSQCAWGWGLTLAGLVACSGGQTGDAGTGSGDCVTANVEQVSLAEAADRGFNVRGWLTNLLGAEHAVERDVVVVAPSTVWLDADALPPSNRTTSGALRLEATGMARITTFEDDPEAECPPVGAGNVDVSLTLTEPATVLQGTASVLPEYLSPRYLWAELPSFSGPVDLADPPHWDFFTGGSVSDRLFNTRNWLVASTECEELTSTSTLSVAGRSVADWLALTKLTTGLELPLSCALGAEPEPEYTLLPDRELSLQLSLPERFCPSRAQPGEVTAIASAALGDTQYANLDAWIRPGAAEITVYVSPSIPQDQSRREGLLLELDLDGERELVITYHLKDEPHTTCSARVPVP